MVAREEPIVLLRCGHYVHLLGALHVLGNGLGSLEQWCRSCGKWQPVPKRKVAKAVKLGKEVLF